MVESFDFASAWRVAVVVVRFVVGFVGAYVAGSFVARPVFFRLLRTWDVGPAVRRPMDNVIDLAVVVLAGFVGLYAAGLEELLTATSTVAAAATVALGVAAKDLVGNVFSGMFVVVNDDINVGDWIEWGEYAGVVENVSFRVTNVRTFSNEVVTVPNSVLVNTPVTNPVSNGKLRLECEFGIGYEEDVATATRVIREVAAELDEVAAEPAPSVRTTDLGPSAVVLEGRVWIENPTHAKAVRVRSAFAAAVKERLLAEGTSMPSPIRQLTGSVSVAPAERGTDGGTDGARGGARQSDGDEGTESRRGAERGG